MARLIKCIGIPIPPRREYHGAYYGNCLAKPQGMVNSGMLQDMIPIFQNSIIPIARPWGFRQVGAKPLTFSP